MLGAEADAITNRIGQAFENPAMLVQDPDNLGHLRINARDGFSRVAFEPSMFAIDFSHLSDKRRLILNEHRHRFVKPRVAVGTFSGHVSFRATLSREWSEESDLNRGEPLCTFVTETVGLPLVLSFFPRFIDFPGEDVLKLVEPGLYRKHWYTAEEPTE